MQAGCFFLRFGPLGMGACISDLAADKGPLLAVTKPESMKRSGLSHDKATPVRLNISSDIGFFQDSGASPTVPQGHMHTMDQYQSWGKRLTNFQGHWAILKTIKGN